MARKHFGVTFTANKTAKDIMYILGLNKTVDQLPRVVSMHWYGHVLRKKEGRILCGNLEFDVENQSDEGRHNRILERKVVEDNLGGGEIHFCLRYIDGSNQINSNLG